MNERGLSQYLGMWLIEPSHGQTLQQSIRGMDWKAHFAAAAERKAAGTLDGQPRNYSAQNGVAIIQANGVLTKGGSSLAEDGSTIRLRQQIRRAVRDDQISAIMLVIDSPGGTVAGTADLADEVRRAKESKPVYAFVEDLCASASYWMASQATEIHANNSTALIGSIGTYTVVYDASKAFEQEGVKAHLISTGAFKGAGELGTEITAEQLENWQSLIDQSQKPFAAAVKAGRKLNAEQMEQISDGRTWTASDALKHGLIDAISSFDDVLGRAAAAKKKGRTMSGEADSAPRGATLAELKTIGASSDFVVLQLEKGATLADAKSAWVDQRMAAMEKREEENKAKEADFEKREKAIKDAEAKAKTSGGLKVLRDPEPNGEQTGGGSASEEFKSLVEAKVKGGMSRPKAVSAVVRENPDLHQRMLDEAPRVEIDRNRKRA